MCDMVSGIMEAVEEQKTCRRLEALQQLREKETEGSLSEEEDVGELVLPRDLTLKIVRGLELDVEHPLGLLIIQPPYRMVEKRLPSGQIELQVVEPRFTRIQHVPVHLEDLRDDYSAPIMAPAKAEGRPPLDLKVSLAAFLLIFGGLGAYTLLCTGLTSLRKT